MDAKIETSLSERAKLSVRNLNFFYGSFHALKNINLDIPEKKVTAFIGPSGCGKSTLLRTLNRMFELYPEQRAEGEILLDGENILQSKDDVSLIHADLGTDQRDIVLALQDVLAIQQDLAFGALLGIELEHAVQRAQQRRLAAARRADEGGDLLLGDVEVDVLQRVEAAVEEVQVAHRELGALAQRGFDLGVHEIGSLVFVLEEHA